MQRSLFLVVVLCFSMPCAAQAGQAGLQPGALEGAPPDTLSQAPSITPGLSTLTDAPTGDSRRSPATSIPLVDATVISPASSTVLENSPLGSLTGSPPSVTVQTHVQTIHISLADLAESGLPLSSTPNPCREEEADCLVGRQWMSFFDRRDQPVLSWKAVSPQIDALSPAHAQAVAIDYSAPMGATTETARGSAVGATGAVTRSLDMAPRECSWVDTVFSVAATVKAFFSGGSAVQASANCL